MKAIWDGDCSSEGAEVADDEEEPEVVGGRPRGARHREGDGDDGGVVQLKRPRWQEWLLSKKYKYFNLIENKGCFAKNM